MPEQILDDPGLLDAVLFGEDLPDSSANQGHLDLDRTWHLLHFLLTDSADAADHPLSFLAAGGRAISEDLGNGPLRAFTAAQVRALSHCLDRVRPEHLLEKFDPQILEEAQIYGWPEGWQGVTVAECGPLVSEILGQLKAFLQGGAVRGRALLVYAL